MEYVSGLFCATNYSCVRCACVDDLDEADDFDRLRAYAVSRLGAPPDDEEGEASGCVTRVVSEPVDEQEFARVFRRVLERRGWPVAKYGRGKALRRCLKVFAAADGALRLEWGSRKNNSDAARSVLLTEIVDISRVIFEDAPDYADPQMALCFNVGDTAALKILADTVTDATILAFGFGLLVDEARARRQNPVDADGFPTIDLASP
mmetsp:Transcript_13415/g.35672  ORF Transcript_13415/g.35672 Transcript_13415/m.35672 type:complete len:206 (+) Transcript_13415:294-911(+)